MAVPPEAAGQAAESRGSAGDVPASKPHLKREQVVIRFAGDSGDGMQLTGMQFTAESALAGNDIATLPDFPAEIRAPAGTLAGVSGFQLNFSSSEIFTAGDEPNVLVAMNPAALQANLEDVPPNAVIIVDREAFNDANLKKVGYKTNPLNDHSLDKFQLVQVDVTKLTTLAVHGLGLNNRTVFRCRNMFVLGMLSWLYQRPIESTIKYLESRFQKTPDILEANIRVLKAGFNYGETTEMFASSYEVPAARIAPGLYRNITGNSATALGFVAAAVKSGRPLFLGSYPITPASDILHDLAGFKNFPIYTFQAEDEIAGVCSAIGAAFGGAIGITTTSGPGMNLKAEAVGLAVKVELPLVITDIQRAGPSTGMPTKPEQADLLQSMYGRHGESPIPIIAAATPADCFDCAYEAVRIAIKYMTPVILLTDGQLANSSEPWLLPDPDKLTPIPVEFRTNPEGFMPYLREEETLARPWAIPGTKGLEHRVGGIAGEHLTGNISYSPANNELMVRMRARKIAGIAREIPKTEVLGDPEGGDLVVLGWGSTYGPIREAVKQVRAKGKKVSQVHLRYLNPMPRDLGETLKRFKQVMIAEMNMGQLLKLVRADYLIDAFGFNKIQGRPFKVSELVTRINRALEG
ncbi:MAG: 2-oxoacid:acceptor oxidoreductase subunit alpha [Candidatus Binatus sp.]|uniref:2-oxoacid:acceptor oxidoreductase subunit alpha n=1 Tax=Candidatus Binatus sp. TaxID=2811406 RepID=UPI0027276020|nr:2-oxoacid:acceptor oxidoreductase subunit alpha [Candidatus Binatus sp.]MDO8431722.1 2-oxoacid:acceptor oxidoreductase subunit alpha [Candidatus Binatus sp.]